LLPSSPVGEEIDLLIVGTEAGVNTLYVALGGAIGGTARYVIDTTVLGLAGNPDFPLGMFIVNITGAFLIGVAFGISQKNILSSGAWSFLVIGLLGAYTSFSDFALKTLDLFANGEYGDVLLNLLTGPLGIIAVFLGVILTSGLPGIRDAV
jgi:CrcB protein